MGNCTKKCGNQNRFYGTTILGERGQVVIPVKARKDFNLKKGEQLLVFGVGKNMVALIKVDQVKEFANHLSKKLNSINSVLKNITKG